MTSDTIYAVSSGGLPSGVAIIRLSGPQVRFALEIMIGSVPPARQAHYGSIRDRDGDLIDRGLVLYFPAPHSFTGEDVAELHIHGSVAVAEKLLACLGSLPQLRLAQAGEFSRRAFAHGKMDLTAAEALADLIAAETESQRVMALRNADGAQFALYAGWNQILRQCRAYLEAEIDFTDEEGVPGSVADQVQTRIIALRAEVAAHASGQKMADMVREGFRVVIVGAPNAGKSTLLNALVGRDAAIVSEIAGTTRDIVEQHLTLGKHKVLVSDTAGLHASDDAIEKQGMARALLAVEQAHLVIHLSDGDFEGLALPQLGADQILWRVQSKMDRGAKRYAAEFHISAVTQQDMEVLRAALSSHIDSKTDMIMQVLPTRQRHQSALKECLEHLDAIVLQQHAPIEMRTESLRLASVMLEELVGVIGVEDVLGSIFSEFCIGK